MSKPKLIDGEKTFLEFVGEGQLFRILDEDRKELIVYARVKGYQVEHPVEGLKCVVIDSAVYGRRIGDLFNFSKAQRVQLVKRVSADEYIDIYIGGGPADEQ